MLIREAFGNVIHKLHPIFVIKMKFHVVMRVPLCEIGVDKMNSPRIFLLWKNHE